MTKALGNSAPRNSLTPGQRRDIVASAASIGKLPMTKILLIEDDSETAEEIADELVQRGFEIERAASGIEGLDKARSCRPDALIVDRMLPGMDGLTIIEALRQERVRTPVLILSALGAIDERVRGLRSGGDDYLTKPFAIVELVARIEALLRRPASPGKQCCAWDHLNSTSSNGRPSAATARSSCCRGNSACSST